MDMFVCLCVFNIPVNSNNTNQSKKMFNKCAVLISVGNQIIIIIIIIEKMKQKNKKRNLNRFRLSQTHLLS